MYSKELHCTLMNLTVSHNPRTAVQQYTCHCSAVHYRLHCTALNRGRARSGIWHFLPGHVLGSPRYVLTCTALHYTTLHCTALHCTALHCTELHCTALHCTALFTALHCTVGCCHALGRWRLLHSSTLSRTLSSSVSTGAAASGHCAHLSVV